jgi:transcription elongation GreA/GreB family factor
VSVAGLDELDRAREGVSWISPIAAALLKAQFGDRCEVVSDPEARYWAAGSRSTRSCRWARRA